MSTSPDTASERIPDDKGTRGFMCVIDFECELGAASGGNTVYPSIDDLKRRHSSWKECGIVEVRVAFIRTIEASEVI